MLAGTAHHVVRPAVVIVNIFRAVAAIVRVTYTHVTNAFVLRCIKNDWPVLSVVISRFATRCGRTVAMPSPRFSRKKSNLKNHRLVRFFADKYDGTEPI